MNETLKTTLEALSNEVGLVSEDRKPVLEPLVEYILSKQRANDPVKLNFICTHNARRSHISQLLAAATSLYADLENIECYSGGTEASQIHPNAKAALEVLGFVFAGEDEGDNPHYLVDLGEANMLEIFSKVYNDDDNPQREFAAVMVCSAAEEACPFAAGAEKRMSVTFEDPKEFDDEEDPIPGYVQRSREIGRELMYVMSQVSFRLEA